MRIPGNVALFMARRSRGLLQQDLADKVRLGNKVALVLIERHGWIPPDDLRCRLTHVLGSTEEALFAGQRAMAQINVQMMTARRGRGLTQGELAKKCGLRKRGLTSYSVALMERYGWVPPEPVRRRLADVLQSTERELFSNGRREVVST